MSKERWVYHGNFESYHRHCRFVHCGPGISKNRGIKDLRKSTAELLAKMEQKIREEEAAKVEKEKTQE